MTESVHDDELRDRFAPLWSEIAPGAAGRDRERTPLHAEVELLRRAGVGALRVPVRRGGHGASVRQLLGVLIDAGAADSNLPQILRQHFFQVELLLLAPDAPANSPWIDRVVAGDIFGSGTTEPRGSALGVVRTVLSDAGDGTHRLTGRKIYGTGNAYAQWIPVGAVDDSGNPVVPVVPADREGVTLHDDWSGFGQRLTATATTTFDDVVVRAEEIRRPGGDGPRRGGSGLHQAILLAALAGVLDAAANDLRRVVAGSRRVYFTGSGRLPADDAVVQEHVGLARAAADSARLLLDGLGRRMDDAWRVWHDRAASAEAVDAAFEEIDFLVAAAQVTVSDLALTTTARLLDVLGASSLDVDLGLDRHWRNARALTSHNPAAFKARLIGDHVLNGASAPAFAVGRDVGDLPQDGKDPSG